MGPAPGATPTAIWTRVVRGSVGLVAAGAAFLVLPAAAAVAGSVSSSVSTASVQFGPSGSVTDTVTVAGNATDGSPTGTVDFYVCQTGTSQTLTTGPCTAAPANAFGSTHLSAGANDTATATTASFTPTAGGTWCFSATYGGDTNYAADADNTDGTNLDANECLLVTAATTSSYSLMSAVHVTLGPSGTVTDLVTVQGTVVGVPPTGTVAYYACQMGTSQTYSPSFCSPGTAFDTETLSPGAGDSASAQSGSFTPTGGGTWCISAVYGGDVNYSASADNTSSGNEDSNECVLVNQATPATTTSQISSANISLGPTGSVTDTVTVQGNSAGGSPSGTVTFYVCQTGSDPQNLATGSCPTSGSPEGTGGLVAGLSNAASAPSPSFTPSSPGTWCFSATYGGDNNYTGTADNTDNSNLDANECVLVGQASSTTTTTSSGNITLGNGSATDSVSVQGNSLAGSPTGTVDFYVCQTSTSPTQSDGACAATGPVQSSPSVIGGANDTSGVSSAPYTPATPGTYCFSAVYLGDSNYATSSDNTDNSNLDSNECFFVSAIAPVVTTQPSSQTVAVGTQATFTAAATGAPTPTVQWQVSTNGGTSYADIGSATSNSYTVTMTLANSGDWYRAVFSNFGGTATTNGAGGAVLGGSATSSKKTLLYGNKVVKVSGASWYPGNGDTSVSIAQCTSSVYSPNTCGSSVTASVKTTGPVTGIGKFPATALTILAGTMDPDTDTCGLTGSPACYIVVRGNTNDSNFVAITFSVPTVTVSKTTSILGNFDVLVHATHFPIGDSVFTEECDSSATTSNLSTHCDAATEKTAVASATGAVPFPSGIAMAVGSAYSDNASGSCATSATCYFEVIDSSNSLIHFLVGASTADPTVTLKKTTAVVGNLDNLVHALHFPIGDSVFAEQCDNTANGFNLSTHCDASTRQSAVAGATGTVPFTSGVVMAVGSNYSDGAGGTCTGGTTCYIEVIDSSNSAIRFLQAVSMATPTVTLTPSSQATGGLVKVTATGFPIGDGAGSSECDTAATASNIGTNCDSASSDTGTASSSGVVVWTANSGKIPVLSSTHGSPLYTDSSSPPATCAPGDTVGANHPCYIEVHDTANAAVIVLVKLSVTS